MKTISSTDHQPAHIVGFIREVCPWTYEDFDVGYIFVLDDEDIGTTTISPLPWVGQSA